MPQDAFTIKYITEELREYLIGGKISKITQPDKDTVTFIIYTKKHSVKLDVCLSAKHCRVSLTDNDFPAPKSAPNFCMLLRKHLQNAEITDISQPDFERIIVFDFDCTSEFELTKMRLYCEIMGKYSNLILTQGGVIVGALKSNFLSDTTKRLTFTGVNYTPPEPQDKLNPNDKEAVSAEICNSSDKMRFLADRVKGISYSTAVEMVEFFGEEITAQNVYDYVNGGEKSPSVQLFNGEMKDFCVKSTKVDVKKFDTVLDAQKYFYDNVLSKQAFDDYRRKLLAILASELKKCRKRLAVIEQKLLETSDAEEVKLKGELITSNIYNLKQGMDSFEAVNYYDEQCGKIKITLDKTLSPSKNAQKYYKRYAKLKRTILSVSEQKSKESVNLDYLESISSHLNLADKIQDLKEIEEELVSINLMPKVKTQKAKPVLTPFREYKFMGFKIISGRNNLQNDRLLKELSSEDVWLHTHSYHSSHVGILSDGKIVPDEVILCAAEICAYYSDGRHGNKIPVDYTKKKFVKKPKGRAAGFVNYTDYSTLLCDPNVHEELKEIK